ncbi:MAG: two pore domain potassium channel family protein [Duncaniella sp.]|nr:two pore domain potassium channel family protein [Duncaniella sp.]MDE6859113.1 two pore domain potassium channel family protein [Duncaniella sp.]
MIAIEDKTRRRILDVINWVLITLSVLLITFISIDTFKNVDFLTNPLYMNFQLWACITFLTAFFIELFISDNKWRYFRHNWMFFVLSIPYLNILRDFNILITPEELFYVRFIPLARGIMAMVIVVGAISRYRITSFLCSYIIILCSFIYLGSLIFLYKEHGINPMVNDFGSALWWACMNATTLGCTINPVTVTGKIIGCVVSVSGIIMFPLFTVYFTALIQRYRRKNSIS